MHLRPCSVLLGLLLGLLTLQATAKKDSPEIKSTPFEGLPSNPLYFEDSDIVLITNIDTGTIYRSDDGGNGWKPLADVEEGEVVEVLPHPYDKKVAVVLGRKKQHWITKNRGETWRKFTTDEHPVHDRPGINFHADDPDRMLFLAQSYKNLFPEYSVYYTKDGFESDPKLLHKGVSTCIWAKSTDIFTTGDPDLDKNTVLCVAQGKFSFAASSTRVLITSDYFESDPSEPLMPDGKPVPGVTNLAAVKSYIVFAAKSEGTTELSMQVTTDTKTWHRAEFGEHKLEEDAYTLLESTNYSMQVDVMNSKYSPMGVLLTSESNGTQFSRNVEHTNRNIEGFVDFEKVSNIQGIVLVNVVENWKDVQDGATTRKKLKSLISFNDGRDWSPLKADGKDLHLHSVTEQTNVGRIFSSPAPGIVMGVGNVGDNLRDYSEGDLYISRDAGLTWTRAQSKPHLYEFGASGSVLVAVEPDETDEIKWSLDYGKEWKTTSLDEKVKPFLLTTTPDSTSLKFLMIASRGRGQDLKNYIYALDFENLHERECKDSDMETWSARVDEDGEPQCIMGHTQSFRRRKPDADCLVVVEKFEDPEVVTKDCKCTDLDFECDYNFKRDDDKCVPIGAITAPDDACKDGEDEFEGPSGYRLIPGNTCIREGGKSLDQDLRKWSCKAVEAPSGSGKVSTEIKEFPGSAFVEYYYLERSESNSGNDETVIMRTDRREVWLTKDHGKHWEPLLADEYEDEEIVAIYPHQYDNEKFYLITPSKKVIYSTNRGTSLHSFNAPEVPNRNFLRILQFHPKESDWLIWTGGADCNSHSQDCSNAAYISRHGGETWDSLLSWVRKCQFIYSEGRQDSDNLIFCEQYAEEAFDSSISLIGSNDWFDHKQSLKSGVINFATMAEYIVVALRDEDEQTLKVDTSIDGATFADAKFPRNFQVPHQQAYTVLDSSTHAVFLHVTVNNREGQEYGSILKSNSNGTSYVLSASEVNRNSDGYVDFEKMLGLEGVAIINRVANVQQTDDGGSKKLKTYITHNDGAAWALITRPADPPKELEVAFECQGTGEKCSLHLHGYTERRDPRATYSSPSAVGLMIATGNVGEYLGPKRDAHTFITVDGGITWKLIKEGNWMWEYGDQGSVIVLVKEDEPTQSISYTLDEGASWTDHKFADGPMLVSEISTVPSDTSLNFLLWGKSDGKLVTVNLDFTGLSERSKQCHLDDEHPDDSDDYTLWSPKHPLLNDDCLFGHVAQYHRKEPDINCYNGRMIQHLHSISKNCSCTRQDFECDYNYELGPTGECRLVDGAEKPEAAAVCKENPNLIEYYDITGYRRIPLTTCTGGDDLEYTQATHPCPGFEEEYKEKHGISGVGLFFAITIPIAAAAGIGYWVYQKWDGKFGRIRLGDHSGVAGASSGAHLVFFDREAPWIRYPVIALSGIIAVIATLPMLVGSLWNAASTRLGRRSAGGSYSRPFTSRGSFQRGRGNYAVVDPDEGELLGDDSDEDV